MQMLQSKITTTDFVIKRTRQIRSVTKTVVLCYGNFDFYNANHVDMLEKAKTCGDMLVVVVDSNVDESKNIFPKQERLLLLASNECVDYIVYDVPIEVIEKLKPEVVVSSYAGKNPNHINKPPELITASSYGGKIVLMPQRFGVSKDTICQTILTRSQLMSMPGRIL